MPNPKPSERITEALEEAMKDGAFPASYATARICTIFDETYEELAALRKEVEELKKSKINPNRFCFVEGCKDTELHAHAMPL